MGALWEEQAGREGGDIACYMGEQWEYVELYPRWMWRQVRTGLVGRLT